MYSDNYTKCCICGVEVLKPDPKGGWTQAIPFIVYQPYEEGDSAILQFRSLNRVNVCVACQKTDYKAEAREAVKPVLKTEINNRLGVLKEELDDANMALDTVRTHMRNLQRLMRSL